MFFTTINTPHDPINNSGIIRNEFDNAIDKSVYDKPNIYEDMYTQFKKIITDKNNCYINISTDRAISSASLSSLNELYCYKNGQTYDSDLKIIYIDSIPDLNINNYDDELVNKSYRQSVVSNLLTLSADDDISRSYTKHKLSLKLSQFTFIGLQEVNPREENLMLTNNSQYYSLVNLNKKIDKIVDSIINKIDDNPIAIIFDMSVFDINIAPCVIRDSTDNIKGLNLDQLNLILNKLSELNKKYNNIKMIDITGHYLSISDTSPAFRVTIETITKIYSKLLNLKEYAINIFNEHTRFLIFKPVEELCKEEEDNQDNKGDNYGWYILRNIPLSTRNELIKDLDIDSIIMLNIPISDDDDNQDIMISTTTIYEQNEKCYYTAKSYKDCTLYPYEKMAMCFELINN
jgi:arginase family enzyme